MRVLTLCSGIRAENLQRIPLPSLLPVHKIMGVDLLPQSLENPNYSVDFCLVRLPAPFRPFLEACVPSPSCLLEACSNREGERSRAGPFHLPLPGHDPVPESWKFSSRENHNWSKCWNISHRLKHLIFLQVLSQGGDPGAEGTPLLLSSST